MIKTKEHAPVKVASPKRVQEPARPAFEALTVRPVFSTQARSNGVPAAIRAAELAGGPGSMSNRARMAAGMQRTVGNARMGRLLEPGSGVTGTAAAGRAVSDTHAVTDATAGSPAASTPQHALPAAAGQEHPSLETQAGDQPRALSANSHAAPAASQPAAVTPGPGLLPSPASRAGAVSKRGGANPSSKAPSARKAKAGAGRSAIGSVIQAIRHRAASSAKLPPAQVPIDSAVGAGKIPLTEQTRCAAGASVDLLSKAKNAKVDRSAFRNKLKDAIAEKTKKPKTEDEANQVMKSGAEEASGIMGGEVSAQSNQAGGDFAATAVSTAGDLAPSTQQVEPRTPQSLVPEAIGAAPAPVGAAGVVPAPLPPEGLDFSAHRGPTDQALAENGITLQQLQNGNEPEFQQNLASRAQAEQHASGAVTGFRKAEANMHNQVEATANTEITRGLAGFHAARAQRLAVVTARQNALAAQHQNTRQQVTNEITKRKNDTRKAVQDILCAMMEDAEKTFSGALTRAEGLYHEVFEKEKGGWVNRVAHLGSWDETIQEYLDEAREAYLNEVYRAVDEVADKVDRYLDAARARVEQGRKDVEDFVTRLDPSLARFAAGAVQSVQEDFNQMNTEIDQSRDALEARLNQDAQASYDRMSKMEEQLREENKSLWDKIYDATVGLIKQIKAFKDMLLRALAKAADAIGAIIAHPINFLGNLVSAGKLGFLNFSSHILKHLENGFLEWLLAAVASTGLQLPKNFDPEGIFNLVMQILGLTYPNIRSRAVNILGENVVKSLETAAEIFKILITQGPAGLWDHIKHKVGDLKAMVIEKIKAFVMEKILIAGVAWIIQLLNPASAFFKACKAIYDIVMFFVGHMQQIRDLVNAVTDSISAIAKGAIGSAAGFVENSLAKTVPIIIGFLAALLPVSGVSDKIKEIIEAIRKPINEAIDWVIHEAAGLVKTAGKVLGFGKKAETQKKIGHAQHDPDNKTSTSEGPIDIPLSMSGERHELIIVTHPSPSISLASSNPKSIERKAGLAIAKLQSLGPLTRQQSLELRLILAGQERIVEALKQRQENQAKAIAEQLVGRITAYATRYGVRDLEDTGYPAPQVGSYSAMSRVRTSETLPDGLKRTAHHVPPVRLARSLAEGMEAAAQALAPFDLTAARIIRTDSWLMDRAANTGHGGPLPTILIHPHTHTAGMHARTAGPRILQQLRASGVFVALAALRKDTREPASNAQRKNFQSMAYALTRQTRVATEKVVQEAFAADKERAVLIVKDALSKSRIDGSEEGKERAVDGLEELIKVEWQDMLLGNMFRDEGSD